MSATTHGGGHGGHHGPIAWPSEPIYGTASQGKLGMWIFLLSDAFSFGGLLLAYGIMRGSSAVWRCTEALAREGVCLQPPLHNQEPELGINFTAVLTFLLICSSVTMVMAHAAAVEGKRKQLIAYLALTVLGGTLFLVGQYEEYWGIVGHGLLNEGLIFGHSLYATTFYLITSFHGLHVTTGVIYLTVILIRAIMGKYDHGNHDHIEIAGLFWHFVDLVWILVFTFIYLIPEPTIP
jgi:heme/copper-type cytochrome/quinol oxidase subunit 3